MFNMQKVKVFFVLSVIVATGINLSAQEIDFGFKSKWNRHRVSLKASKDGLAYNCFKYYSVMNTNFDEIKLGVKEEISLSFKVKGVGELKPDAAGFRFGLFGKTSGYAVNCGTEKKGLSILLKSSKAPGLLSGRGFRGIISVKNGNISSEKFTDFKLTITNLGNDEIEFKLYIDSMLTIKCKRSKMTVTAFNRLALGTGGKVNSFIIKDLKVKKGK